MTLVSVIIPVFNCERYVAAAIESVLKQTTQPEEVVVVDDGSTDDTPRILAALSPRVTFVRQPNCGAATAINRGLEAARAAFFVFWMLTTCGCLTKSPDSLIG